MKFKNIFVKGCVILAISEFVINGLCSEVMISEFMASNSRTIADEDGSYEDWIEIYNNGTNIVNLGGWYLTDSKNNLRNWMFPATNLNVGSYLVVFASGKDRSVAGRNLHANFKLSGSGEYLALVEPDGVTIASEFSPTFPTQFADVSYGYNQESQFQKVVSSNSQVKILIPTNDAFGQTWRGGGLFDDSSWLTGTNGVGFDVGARESGEIYADLKNYYPFENNAVDSVGGVSGSLNGSPNFNAGHSGQAISLNGTSQYVSLLSLNLPTKFSISVWVKPIQKDNIMTISASSIGGSTVAGFRFFINRYKTSDGVVNFETGDGTIGAVVRSLYPVNWGEWNHIVVVVDRAAGRGKILLNGVDVTSPSENTVATGFPNPTTWEMGRMSTAGFYYQGLIDDYAFWQGELSSSQVAALISGSSPTNLFVFKQFIRTDLQSIMYSNNATAYIRIPFTISDPTAIQTLKLKMRYDDGFVAYLNGVEVIRKNTAQTGDIADSIAEFSGTQGQYNWFYGYYDKTVDANQTYQSQDFIQFPSSPGPYGSANYWTGSSWDWYNGNPPWTELNSNGGHPNGSNNGNIHWAVRRWVSETPGILNITIRLAKGNPGCGSGTTGRIFHNGVEKFSKTITYNDSTGITTNLIIYDVNAGDFIDFVIDPTGTDGQPTDPCDTTIFTASIQNLAPDLAYNSTAITSRSNILAVQFEEYDIYGMRRHLKVGNNILAIQGLNVSATNGDFFIEAELEAGTATDIRTDQTRYFALPTPGAPNGAGTSDLGPIIKEMSYNPSIPGDSDDILVTASVSPSFAPVVSNVLYYRVMYGAEVSVPMIDDGKNGDIVAGDGIYSAIIPATASTPGQMVRWYMVAIDSSNRVSRFPILTDTNSCPIYLGTVIKDPSLTNPLPVFHWFIQNATAADSDAGTRCSVFYDGIFYDNVYINLHGQSSRGFPKKSYDIEFNPGYSFRYDRNETPVGDINFMTTYPDKAHMRNILAYETYKAAGSPYHWVIPARVQQNGSFWGDIHIMENGDTDYLERNGKDPNGPLYKMYNTFSTSPGDANIASGNAEKKSRKWEGNADLLALLNGVIQTDITNRTMFLYDNVDIPQMINMLAARVVTGDQDCCHKNYYLYRDTMGNGEWQAFAWDVDLSFGRRWISSLTYWDDTIVINTYMPVGDNNGLFKALYQTPQIAEMYWRRLRTLMDEILQPPGTPTNQLIFEKRINELTSVIAPDAALDLSKWGTWGNGSASSTCCVQTQPQAADIIKNTYLPQRRLYLFSNMIVTAGGKIPLSQPSDAKIAFGKIEFNPASGKQSEEYIQLTNFNSFAVDISGWKLDGGVRHIFKPGTVIPSNGVLYISSDVNAFRARQVQPKGGMALFVQGDYEGQLSARGESIILLDKNGNYVNIGSYTPAPSLAQQYLRVTELMYNPSAFPDSGYDAQEFEYIELKNISSFAISLAGVRFTNGVCFDFSNSPIQTLGAGQTVLVVKNVEAFTLRYGNVSNIAGVYSGSLENNGERITLLDSNGEEILDFNYDNNWYPLTDGFGFALVVVNDNAAPDDWNKKYNWRAGSVLNGTPGTTESQPIAIPHVVINEVLSRSDNPPPFDTIELLNMEDYPVNISGWFLTDDFRTPAKYRIPDGTIIQPHSLWTVDEQQFNNNPGAFPSFALSANGDEVYLFSTDTNGNFTGYFDGYQFGASENGVTFGRYVTSDGNIHFVSQLEPTLGYENNVPLVGPVVISEIMYNPPSRNSNDPPSSYIELINISTNEVRLFIEDTTNVWKLSGGIEFDFPTNTTLSPQERILIVGFDVQKNPSMESAFRSIYHITTNARIFGAFSKKLNNDEDKIQLIKPVYNKVGEIMDVLVEEVHYKDYSPWPPSADGIGLSLQRLYLDKFGNEPTNWVAVKPNPGDMLVNWDPPIVIIQPQSQKVILNSNIVLNVQAIGPTSLQYQWRLNGANIEGATNYELQIPNAQLYHSGVYQACVISENGSTFSDPAQVSVMIPATILSQPQDVALFPGDPAVLGVAVSSISAVSYQWLKNDAPIPGGTNAILTIPSVSPLDVGDYAVLISDETVTIKSQSAKLTVWLHPIFVIHPKTTNINPGATASFTAQAISHTPVQYQWRRNGIEIPGETNESITIVNAQLEQAGLYTAVATDSYGSIESDPADLNVLVKPSIIKQLMPSNIVAYVGEDVSFEIGANGLLPISYRFRKNSGTVTNIILRDTNCVFTITNVQFEHAGYYDVAMTNVAGNANSLSTRAYLTVMTPMSNAIARPGSNAVFTINAKVTSSTTVPSNMALKYKWFFNETNLLIASGINYLTITNATYENEGVYTVIATNLVGTVITQSALLIITEKPIIVRHPSSQVVAAGANAEFSVIAEDAEPLHYRWFFNDVEIPDADMPILTITNAQQLLAGKYFVIVWNNAGSVTSEVATLTVQSGNDSDNDGLPDEWEISNGLNPQFNDAIEDKDKDGLSNLAEYIAGTNPNDATSKLKIASIVLDNNKIVRIEFEGVAGKQYMIEYKTNINSGLWNLVTNLTANSTNKVTIIDHTDNNHIQRFYRIVIP